MKPMPIMIPTLSGLVPHWDDLTKLYIVKFHPEGSPAPKKPKHGGGYGLPGERWQGWHTQPWTSVAEGMMPQELGLHGVTAEQTYPFVVRIGQGRDVRAAGKMTFPKYVDKLTEVPEPLAAVPATMLAAHHCVDVVALVLGVNTDPATLVPTDPDEIDRIDLLDVTEPPSKLPISDDLALVELYRKVIFGEVPFPESVALNWCATDEGLLRELKTRITTGQLA